MGPTQPVGIETAAGSCPKCGYGEAAAAGECPRCGVVFRKLAAVAAAEPRIVAAAHAAPEREERNGPGRAEWKMLGVAFAAGLLANLIPFVAAVLSVLATLFHELGHAVASWLLGHPAVPAFDFVYGGGFTHEDNFKPALALLVGGGWVRLGWLYRRRPRPLALFGACAALWLVAISSEWRREVVIGAMGHVGELVLAAVFVFMALANVGWRVPEVERPLGAFLGCFVQIHTMHFAWKLMHDAEFLAWYREGKGGALMNDLESIALDLHIHTGIPLTAEAIAGWLFALAFVSFGGAVTLAMSGRTLRIGGPASAQ
jgi:hypothetical protein